MLYELFGLFVTEIALLQLPTLGSLRQLKLNEYSGTLLYLTGASFAISIGQ